MNRTGRCLTIGERWDDLGSMSSTTRNSPGRCKLLALVVVLHAACGTSSTDGGTAASGGKGGSAGSAGAGGLAGSAGSAGFAGAGKGGSGGQGTTCSAGTVACDKTCVVGTCDFAVTSITPVAPTGTVGGAADWVNGGTLFTLHGNGFAKGMRVLLGDGRAPVRVLDSHTATIQSPPGPEGIVDVTLDLSGKTSVAKNAFRYWIGGVESKSPWKKVTTSGIHGDVPAVATLSDGRALVTGGLVHTSPGQAFSNVGDLFSLATPDQAVAASNTMHVVRWNHVMVTLLTGQTAVLSASGVGAYPGADSKIVDLFDPATNTFVQSKATPLVAFQGARAILLVDGRVLLMSYQQTTAEIYDPESDTFSPVSGAPPVDYYQQQGYFYLARLRDGRVLVSAGQGAHAWLFDSDAGTFSDAGPGPKAGADGVFTLPDGRVIAVGGSVVSGGVATASADIELFDPKNAAKGFEKASYSLLAPRSVSATAMQRDGSILVVGGSTGTFPAPYGCGTPNPDEKVTANVDRVDPVSGTVTAFAALPEPNSYVVASTMLDGSVLVAGGGVCGVSELYPFVYFRQAPFEVH